MQINYLYDKDMISQVIPAMQRKLRDAADVGVPQVVNVMGSIILKVSVVLMKQQTPTATVKNAAAVSPTIRRLSSQIENVSNPRANPSKRPSRELE